MGIELADGVRWLDLRGANAYLADDGGDLGLCDAGMPWHAPESCAHCPHIDRFHSACSRPLRQIIVRELDDGGTCPLFPGARAEAMRDLEARLDDLR